jgi:uncharacterized protein YndB with AHSA1/START domain
MTVDLQSLVGGMTAGPGDDDREVVFTRTFEAPRALVFRAWTDPDYLVRWWGPAGFSTVGCTMDARPGGGFSLVMIAPNGLELPAAGTFREVAPPDRLGFVITDEALPDHLRPLLRNYGDRPIPEMHVTVSFQDDGAPDRTRLVMRTRFRSAEDVRGALDRGAPQGWAESLERLAALVVHP